MLFNMDAAFVSLEDAYIFLKMERVQVIKMALFEPMLQFSGGMIW